MLGLVAFVGVQSGQPNLLLDRMVGHWVLKGSIGQTETTHDVDAKWVLNREYVEIHEVSRETDAKGKPAYEAIIYVGADPRTSEYASLWMDTTGYAGFSPDGVGRGKATGDSIGFVFGTPDDGILTTFAYNRAKDAWNWTIDNEIKGNASPFARLALTRKPQ